MTTALHYRVVDVFSRHAFGGNPLAVFVDAPALDARLMRSIARQMNLSETVYARPAADPSRLASFRIFTPTTELPIAGHPTIGATAVVLAQRFGTSWPTSTAVELPIGPIGIDIEHRGGTEHLVWMNQGVPVESTAPAADAKALYRAVGLELSDRSRELEIAVISVGVPILIVPVRDEEALDRATPAGLPAYFAAHPPVRIVYLVSETSTRADISARIFGALAVGIEEDPATGVAAGPLAGYLHRARRLARDAEAVINQGHAMGRSSYLHIRTDGAHVSVGGQVMEVASGELAVDPRPM
ncbi:MAG TPA: PhzF family phenazine biosynthesis protein [Acidimicrobiales bacterium]|nr:PhzF family phenazine biosynthesis protein [Acidimicrobiales bacterium]